jgi:hypothetical protein
MTEGDVEIIGNIEEIVDDIPGHENVVKMVKVGSPNRNQVIAVKVQKEGEEMFCIFKPADGENPEVKELTTIKEFYPRECAAYLISEHFSFDVVPPTIIRKIDGKIGALQLFLDHDTHMNFSRISDQEDGDEMDQKARESDDWGQIAVLDWLLANCERHYENMMVETEDPTKLFAIDHGIILNSSNYLEMVLRGPSLQLTMKTRKNERGVTIDHPLENSLPDFIIQKLRLGLNNHQVLTEKLKEIGIPENEINSFWARVADIYQGGKYLSKYNYDSIMGKPLWGNRSTK